MFRCISVHEDMTVEFRYLVTENDRKYMTKTIYQNKSGSYTL